MSAIPAQARRSAPPEISSRNGFSCSACPASLGDVRRHRLVMVRQIIRAGRDWQYFSCRVDQEGRFPCFPDPASPAPCSGCRVLRLRHDQPADGVPVQLLRCAQVRVQQLLGDFSEISLYPGPPAAIRERRSASAFQMDFRCGPLRDLCLCQMLPSVGLQNGQRLPLTAIADLPFPIILKAYKMARFPAQRTRIALAYSGRPGRRGLVPDNRHSTSLDARRNTSVRPAGHSSRTIPPSLSGRRVQI